MDMNNEDFLAFLNKMAELNRNKEESLKEAYKSIARKAFDIKEAFMEVGFSEDEAFEFAYGLTVDVVSSINRR